ncbi:carbonic anhydrase 15-like [Acipenser ruthenus]|uniref:carbonic anhydrase 15-like n=1 Tax=Acipenser ruthenus TaxID=7906 RepID=UPI00145A68FC|nr:carbonic anhydrase 15-like [Acipenser ruthenus]XP_058850429.1 carbonic anhydrase 15-like [Acipenser ruthenus]
MPFLRAALSFPVLLVLLLLLPPGTEASGGTWCYATQDAACGPAHWKVLDHQCGGANQSPINVDRKTARRSSELGAFVFKGYNTAPAGAWSIANSGHAVQVNLGSDISVSGAGLPAVYNALQFHFHWGKPNGNGSEHQLDGNQYPMEIHIVHMHSKYTDIKVAATDPNGLAVLGFFYKVSDTDNTNYNTIIDGLQSVSYSGDSVDLASTFRLDSLLPSENLLSRYYRYRGSLTTPGCAEAVIWTVFEDPIPISSSQLSAFVNSVHFSASGQTEVKMQDNFRPVQALNRRRIYASKQASMNSGAIPALSIVLLLFPLLAIRLL